MKKKVMYLVTCLLLAVCFVVAAPKSASAATSTYQTIRPFERANGWDFGRDKVGTRYFFGKFNSQGKWQLRFSTSSTGSGTIIATFDQPYTKDYLYPLSLATNGDVAYYVSPGNVLYKYDAVKKVKTELKKLNTTLKSRLSSTQVSARVLSVYGNLVYLGVVNADDYYKEYIYTYDLGAKTLTRVKSGCGVTTNGRYLIYKGGNQAGLYRYDMKNKTSKTILSSTSTVVPSVGATYQSKLYMQTISYNPDTNKYTYRIRAYSYSDLSYVTVKSLTCSENKLMVPTHCYNGYLYYMITDAAADTYKFYKLNLSTKVSSSVSESTYTSTFLKSGSATYFR